MNIIKKLESILLSMLMICSLVVSVPSLGIRVNAVDGRVENAIQMALNIANDPSHGYSQDVRFGPDYDCSSLMYTVFRNAGLRIGNYGSTTHTMVRDFTVNGEFQWITGIDFSSSSQLVRGDILLNQATHTELYLGDNQMVGAHYGSFWQSNGHRYGLHSLGEQFGDQTGEEISVITYSNSSNWQGVLRHVSSSVPKPKVNNPVGVVDVVEGEDGRIHIQGWAFDLDAPEQSLDIHVYIGGDCSNGNASCHALTANVERPDVNSVYGIGGNHGFLSDIDTSKRGQNEVYIYALNVDPTGDNILIDHKTVVIPEPYQTKRTIPDGDYRIVSALDNNKCIDLCAGSADNGTRVEIHSLNGGENQIWHVEYSKDGYYTMINKMSGTALDIPGRAAADMTTLQGYEENHSSAQQFIIKETGDGKNYYIASKCSGLNIDVLNADTTDGLPLVINFVNTSDAERWRFIACNDEGQTIADGDYHVLLLADSSYGLDLYGNLTDNGTNIGIWQNSWDDRQVVTLKYLGDGFYTMKNKESGVAYEVLGNQGSIGQPVTAFTYNETDAQQWMIRKTDQTAAYTIQSKCGGFYIEAGIPDGNGYTETTLQADDGVSPTRSMCQKWIFVPAEKFKLQGRLREYDVRLRWSSISWAEYYNVEVKDQNGKTYSKKKIRETEVTMDLPTGEYSVCFTICNSNYSTVSETFLFEVKKDDAAQIDKNIKFEDAVVHYDGTPKSIRIAGEVPDGISVSYENNDQTEVGTYTVKAIFTDDSQNKTVAVRTAVLEIQPIEASEIEIASIEPQTYTGMEIKPALMISADLSGDLTRLAEGNDYTVVYKDHIEAGTATAEITFCGNYTGNRSVTYEIRKAEYRMDGIRFEDAEFVYDGEEKELEIQGTLPEGVRVAYFGNKWSGAGEYTVTAKFTGDKNHKTIPDRTARLKILPAEVWIPEIPAKVEYTGEVIAVLEQNELFRILFGGSAKDPGEYQTMIALKDTDNYIWADGSTAPKIFKWSIVEKYMEPDSSDVTESDESVEAVKVTEPTVPSETVDLSGLVKPSETEDLSALVKPSETEDLNGLVKPSEPMETTEPKGVSGLVESTESWGLFEWTEPTEPENLVRITESTESAEWVETTETEYLSEPWEATESAIKADPIDSIKTTNQPVTEEKGSETRRVTQKAEQSTLEEQRKTAEKTTSYQKTRQMENVQGLKIGALVIVENNRYVIVDDAEVWMDGLTLANANVRKVVVPDTIMVNGYSFDVTGIETGAFRNSSVTKVVIGNNVKTIEDAAFMNCKKLVSVTMGKNIETIGRNAFKNCKSLKKIVLPNHLEIVDSGAFSGCKKLKNITIKTNKIVSVGKNAWKGISKTARMKVPRKSLSRYRKLFKGKGQACSVMITI